jgi:peptidoglycan/LPS O-acetylase OafA/YrhL
VPDLPTAGPDNNCHPEQSKGPASPVAADADHREAHPGPPTITRHEVAASRAGGLAVASPASDSASPPTPGSSRPKGAGKSRLPALTGLRAFAACNIVFFHFSNPRWFGPFAPIVDNGYTAVSFFLLLSGFILSYNYSGRAQRGELVHWRFWVARLSRLYPIYAFALILSFGMLATEWHARSHAQFYWGLLLTPLLLQGWSPALSTFWNTPAWTMCTEAFFYLVFPFVVRWRRPRTNRGTIALLAFLWGCGMVLPLLYLHLHPDGVLHPDRYTDGFWIRALKFSPPPHLPSFLFGLVLADLDARLRRLGTTRLLLGAIGVGGVYCTLRFGSALPYPLMHDGLLMPLFGCAILGLAGENLLARFFGFAPFLALGQASYCLYILHFNLWQLIHDSGLLERTGLIRYDPWLSYILLAIGAGLALVLIERPMQRRIRRLIP